MKSFGCVVLAFGFLAAAAQPGMAQTIETLGTGFNGPAGVAVDVAGNVFVADSTNSAIKEIAASGGYATVSTLATGFAPPRAVTLDAEGNIFAADSSSGRVFEIVAAGGYATVNIIGTG